MITAVICDDEEKARRLLRHLLENCQYEVKILAETSNLPDAVRAINESAPDVLFLDIDMPQYSGLQIAEFYPDSELPCELVFVTAYNEFAIQALRLSALDYLLKPATIEMLEYTLERVSQGSQHKRQRIDLLRSQYEKPFTRIALPNSSGFQFVELSDILYLEADGMYTHVYLRKGDPILVSKPLADFEKLLQNSPQFFKSHRKYIVNLIHMKGYIRSTNEIRMENNASIPLSRHRKQDFEEEIHSLIPGRN